MPDDNYWIPAFTVWAALLVRLPALARAPRDPLVRSVCAVLLLNGSTFFFANPHMIGVVNRITGVPNVAAPLVYGLICALSASCLVLVVYWRGGPTEQARRTARRWITGYGIIAVLLAVFFAFADAPVERRVDLDTYYAGTFGMREMIVLYLLALSVAAVTMTVMCWRWSTAVTHRPWLRWGLRTIALGYVIGLGYGITKGAAVIARWAGHDLDFLSTDVAPQVAAVGTLGSTAGFLMPLVGERLSTLRALAQDWRTYRALRPLWEELRAATPGIVAPVPISWWSLDLRRMRRTAEIHDGCLALRPYYDAAVAATALHQAQEAGLEAGQAKAAAQAAVLTHAIWNKITGTEPAEASGEDLPFDMARPPGLDTLLLISTALTVSPVSAAARRHAAHMEMSDHA